MQGGDAGKYFDRTTLHSNGGGQRQREEGYHISYFLLLNYSGVSNKAPRPPLQLGSSPFHTFGTGIQLRGIKLMLPFIIILESAEGWD